MTDSAGTGFDQGRLQSLSDGVFAIVMTEVAPVPAERRRR